MCGKAAASFFLVWHLNENQKTSKIIYGWETWKHASFFKQLCFCAKTHKTNRVFKDIKQCCTCIQVWILACAFWIKNACTYLFKCMNLSFKNTCSCKIFQLSQLLSKICRISHSFHRAVSLQHFTYFWNAFLAFHLVLDACCTICGS